MLNKVILVGRMCNDPELKYTPNGVAVANFRVAVDRPFTSSQGERQTDFLPVVAWRQNAEFAAQYLTKGRLVLIEGRIQTRSWTTPEGQKRITVEVVADNVRGSGRRREREAAPEAEAEAAPEETPSEEEKEETGEGAPDPFADQ